MDAKLEPWLEGGAGAQDTLARSQTGAGWHQKVGDRKDLPLSGALETFSAYTTFAWRDASGGAGIKNECWSTLMIGGGTWIEHDGGWLGAYDPATNRLQCFPASNQSEWRGTLGKGCVERFFPTTSQCIGDGPPVCGRPSN